MTSVIHITVPCVTIEEFSRMTGLPEGTIRDKVEQGQIPRLPLSLEPGKKEKILINLVKLAQMADNVDFLHPLLNEG